MEQGERNHLTKTDTYRRTTVTSKCKVRIEGTFFGIYQHDRSLEPPFADGHRKEWEVFFFPIERTPNSKGLDAISKLVNETRLPDLLQIHHHVP